MPATMDYVFEDNPNLQGALPEQLVALAGAHPDWVRRPETEIPGALLQELMALAPSLHQAVPYHNWHHPAQVDALLQRLMDAAEVRAYFRGWLRVVAYFHDVQHPGIRYRQYLDGIEQPQLSTEEFSAHITAQLLLARQAPVRETMLVVALIHSSSFAQCEHQVPRRDLARAYGRHQLLEDVFHAADILANVMQGVRPWFFASLALHLEETRLLHLQTPASPRLAFNEWLAMEDTFINYARDHVAKIAPYLNPPCRRELDDALGEIEHFIDVLWRDGAQRDMYKRHYVASEHNPARYHLGSPVSREAIC